MKKESGPKISVVVVNYNGESYIEDCLDSVLSSKYPNFEVVVVENGSNDGSWRLLKKKYGEIKNVHLVKSKTNLFFTGGSNLGAREAKGEWVIFLNADTEVEKEWLRELAKVAKRKGKKMFLQPKIKIFGTEKIDCVAGKYHFPGWGEAVGRGKVDHYQNLIKGDYANGTCLMVNRNMFFELGGFDESFRYFYEDVDLQLRAKSRGCEAVGVMAAVIEHKGSLSFKQNVSSDMVVFYYRRNRLLTVMKNFHGLELLVRLILLVLGYGFLSRRRVSGKAIRAGFDWGMRRVGNYLEKVG